MALLLPAHPRAEKLSSSDGKIKVVFLLPKYHFPDPTYASRGLLQPARTCISLNTQSIGSD